jgi:hypothetical protein
MKICTYARGRFEFSENFAESIQEMLDTGEITTKREAEDYIMTCMVEDIEEWASHLHTDEDIQRHFSFDIVIENKK